MKHKHILKTALSLLLVLLLVGSFSPVAAFADDTDENTEGDRGSGTTNSGTISVNTGTVGTNLESGRISINWGGTVETNKGTVETNYHGTVGVNEGTVVNNIYYGDNMGIVETNKGEITNNYGTLVNPNEGHITNNHAAFSENAGNGSIDCNYAAITENNGAITLNSSITLNTPDATDYIGIIGTNNGTIETNAQGGTVTTNAQGGTITYNYGTVTNPNEGEITTNYSAVTLNNASGGEIGTNYGTVLNNEGTVTDNWNYLYNNMSGGVVENNIGGVQYNSGTVDTIAETGIVGSNSGLVGTNNNAIWVNEKNGVVEENLGTVGSNNGQVSSNEGTVTINGSDGVVCNYNGGTVATNNGLVAVNEGEVSANGADGIVYNHEGGTVETNDGEVFNYGGTVVTNNGTEFFSLEIINETSGDFSFSNGFRMENDGYWLGTVGSTVGTGRVIVTPAAGHEITQILCSGCLKKATKNADGTWTLEFEGGANNVYNLTDAMLKQALIVVSTNPVTNQGMVRYVIAYKESGERIAVNVNRVLTMSRTGTKTSSGTVDFHGFFDEAAEDTVLVPVRVRGALPGEEYTVSFGDGSSVNVVCAEKDYLEIPFPKGTVGLGFDAALKGN